MDWTQINQGLTIVNGPLGVTAVLGFFLWAYDKKATAQLAKAEEGQEKLTTTFEATVKNIIESHKAQQELLLIKAENAEKLCEARYETLMKEVFREKDFRQKG